MGHRRTLSAVRPAARPFFESLESRTLLSAVVTAVAEPVPVHLATTSTPILATVTGIPINAATIAGAHAFVLWDNQVLVKAKVVAFADHFAIVPNSAPTVAGNHTFTIAFWETTPTHIVFDSRLRSGTTTADHNSIGGASFAATAQSAFQDTVGLFTLSLPDSADGQTSPIAVNLSGSQTTLTVTINWGDGISSAGTLTKSSAGHWLVSGTHTYAAARTFRVVITAATPSTLLQTLISTATVSVS